MGVQIRPREGATLRGRGYVLERSNISTREYIATATGDCACRAHASDECIRGREGNMTMRRCGLLSDYFGDLSLVL